MKRSMIFVALSLFLVGHVEAGVAKDSDIDCRLVVTKNLFVSHFPVRDVSQSAWNWNAKGAGVFTFDYSWTAEPGYVDRNGKFKPGEYGFGAAHWNEGGSKEEVYGSIENLVRDAGGGGSVYLNSQDKRMRADAEERLRLWESSVQFTYRDGGVFIASKDRKAMKLLFSRRPTHVRMIVKTPYASQSYECIATIDYQK